MQTKLGQKVQDSITGFAGIVTGKAEYITGCIQILVQPPASVLDKAGEFKEPHWIDEDRVIVLDAEPLVLPRAAPGFDKQAPTK